MLEPTNLGAVIETPFYPKKIMRYVQKLGKVSDDEAYRTWNMGQGMIIITSDPEEVMYVAAEHEIESQIIGEIVKEPGIRIKSRGASTPGRELSF
ncbi:hypothetical protein HYT33_00640 [Candidatus Roizmanbacteria bacterium]|nr:hypothetical protein [Candidatus Roizmanbacteria bacterium]